MSEHTPSSPTPKQRKTSRSKRERVRLHLLPPEEVGRALDLRELGRQVKRLEAGHGKVVSLGGAVFRSNF